jgi:hypothetical protein
MIGMDKDLVKHRAEFARAVRNLKFEQTETGGLYFPEQKATANGVYQDRIRRGGEVIKDWESFPNLLPNQGLNYLLSLLEAGTKITTWYIALYSGAVNPSATWTAANFAATATENTSTSEGYTGSNRITWVPGTAASQVVNNNASPAAFVMATASSVAIEGVAQLSAQARGATTGTLLSAARLPATRTFANADDYDIKYGVALTSS